MENTKKSLIRRGLVKTMLDSLENGVIFKEMQEQETMSGFEVIVEGKHFAVMVHDWCDDGE